MCVLLAATILHCCCCCFLADALFPCPVPLTVVLPPRASQSSVRFRPLPPSATAAATADGVCITNNDCLSSTTQMTPSQSLTVR